MSLMRAVERPSVVVDVPFICHMRADDYFIVIADYG